MIVSGQLTLMELRISNYELIIYSKFSAWEFILNRYQNIENSINSWFCL